MQFELSWLSSVELGLLQSWFVWLTLEFLKIGWYHFTTWLTTVTVTVWHCQCSFLMRELAKWSDLFCQFLNARCISFEFRLRGAVLGALAQIGNTQRDTQRLCIITMYHYRKSGLANTCSTRDMGKQGLRACCKGTFQSNITGYYLKRQNHLASGCSEAWDRRLNLTTWKKGRNSQRKRVRSRHAPAVIWRFIKVIGWSKI